LLRTLSEAELTMGQWVMGQWVQMGQQIWVGHVGHGPWRVCHHQLSFLFILL